MMARAVTSNLMNARVSRVRMAVAVKMASVNSRVCVSQDSQENCKSDFGISPIFVILN